MCRDVYIHYLNITHNTLVNKITLVYYTGDNNNGEEQRLNANTGRREKTEFQFHFFNMQKCLHIPLTSY